MKTNYRDDGVGIGFGPWDDHGAPYITWIVTAGGKALDPKALDRALEEAGAVEMFVRSHDISMSYMRVRFTAYDKNGRNVTEQVIDSTRPQLGEAA